MVRSRPSSRSRCLGSSLLAAATFIVTACGGPPQPELAPIGLEGTPGDLRMLVGSWAGQFRNATTGRTGAIRFRLQAGRDTAYGGVTLREDQPSAACPDPAHPVVPVVIGRIVLRVGRVGVAKGSVGGRLEPYRDPDLGCWIDTWFEGRRYGDSLGGMYFVRRVDGGVIRLGDWWVIRQR